MHRLWFVRGWGGKLAVARQCADGRGNGGISRQRRRPDRRFPQGSRFCADDGVRLGRQQALAVGSEGIPLFSPINAETVS